MEMEVPVEKNTISKHLEPYDFLKPTGTKREGRFEAFSRSESERSQNDEGNSNSDNSNYTKSTTNAKSTSSKSGDEGSYKLPRMLKIAVVGESTAGKTSICETISAEYPTFSDKYRLTCGVEIYAKTLHVIVKSKDDDNNDNGNGNEIQTSRLGVPKSDGNTRGNKATRKIVESQKVNLILLDSSGKDLYVELLPKYWGKLDGIILVIDLTSKQALENAVPWLELAQTSLALVPSANDPKNKVVEHSSMKTSILIGNKMDLKDQCVVSSAAAKDFAKKYGLEYFECSVKANTGIQEAFQFLGKSGLSRISDHKSKKTGKQNQPE